MRVFHRVPAVAFAVLALLPALSAQAVRAGKFRRITAPLRPVSLDLATGTVTRGAATRERGGTTVADFKNLDFWAPGVDSGGGACKWFTAGLKGSGSNQSSNASDLMSEIVFSYCSSAKDVNSGGPGAAFTLGFYEGYTLFGGAPTTPVAVLALSGLPGNTGSSSFLGSSTCYFITINFTDMVAFRDSGPGTHQGIGYSWTFDDLGTDGVWAATAPFLSCVASCSGVVGAIDGQGMTDAIDQYCPPGIAVPWTWFPSTTMSIQTVASVGMQIQEASDRLATNVSYNATITPNADTLTATTPIIGTTWSSTIVKAVPSAPAGFTVRLRANRGLPNGTPAPPPATGRVLIAGPLLAQLGGTHDGTTGSVGAAIPLQLGFCGVHFAAQATTLGGGIKLSSAVEGTTGTF